MLYLDFKKPGGNVNVWTASSRSAWSYGLGCLTTASLQTRFASARFSRVPTIKEIYRLAQQWGSCLLLNLLIKKNLLLLRLDSLAIVVPMACYFSRIIFFCIYCTYCITYKKYNDTEYSMKTFKI